MFIELIIFLVAALLFMFFLHQAVIRTMEQSFLGPPAPFPTRDFWQGIARRVFGGYLLVPLFFALFGTSITLLPHPQFQAELETGAHPPRLGPHGGKGIGLTDEEVERFQKGMSLAFLGSLIMLSALRVLVVNNDDSILSGVTYVVLSFGGFVVFTYFLDLGKGGQYYHTLVDKVMSVDFPNSAVYITLAGSVTCIVTEYLLGGWRRSLR